MILKVNIWITLGKVETSRKQEGVSRVLLMACVLELGVAKWLWSVSTKLSSFVYLWSEHFSLCLCVYHIYTHIYIQNYIKKILCINYRTKLELKNLCSSPNVDVTTKKKNQKWKQQNIFISFPVLLKVTHVHCIVFTCIYSGISQMRVQFQALPFSNY